MGEGRLLKRESNTNLTSQRGGFLDKRRLLEGKGGQLDHLREYHIWVRIASFGINTTVAKHFSLPVPIGRNGVSKVPIQISLPMLSFQN